MIPLIFGCISIQQLKLAGYGSGLTVDHLVISRRSCRRAGTRYHCRGADEAGEVANFVESEQIFSCGDRHFAFVQVRGSVPLLWSQQPTGRPTPPICVAKISSAPREEQQDTRAAATQAEKVDEDGLQLQVMRRHLRRLMSQYGEPLTCINLLKRTGEEAELWHSYGRVASRVASEVGAERLRYHAFDLHGETKGGRDDQVDKLLAQLAAELEQIGYFEQTGSMVTRTQSGIVRINCLDNLDRTQWVMAEIGKQVALAMLEALQVSQLELNRLKAATGERPLLQVWASNGDAISRQYAGTNSLQTEFLKTGQRSRRAALSGALTSASRYFHNNWRDGTRQDAYDLFLGYFRPTQQPPARPDLLRTRVRRTPFRATLFQFISFFLTLWIVTELLAPVGAITHSQSAVVLFWLLLFLFALHFTSSHPQFCFNYPSLIEQKRFSS